MRNCNTCLNSLPESDFRFRQKENKLVTKCRSCEREYQRQWYWNNPEKGRAKAAKSMRKLRSNPERAETQREYQRAYYHAKGKHTEKAYHERIKSETPWAYRAKNARRNCSKFITEQWLREQYDKQGGCCALTGRPIEINTFEIDHILPRSRGGGDELTNLRLLCVEANQAKRALTDAEFFALCADVTNIPELIGRAILEAAA